MYILGAMVAISMLIFVMLIGDALVMRSQWRKAHHKARAPPLWYFMPLVFKTQGKALQKGGVNIGGVLMLGISMVFLAVGAIFLPISTDATTSLIGYSYTSNTSITDASFTGLTALLGITPLLILIGFLAASVITGFMGIKIMKGSGAAHASPGSLILIGLSIVFISVGLLIEPVVLDGFAAVLHGGGAGISSTFTGYSTMVLLAPMLIHIGFLASAVFSGFFGIKKLGSAG